MHEFAEACRLAFPEILAIVKILGAGRSSVRLLTYGDYDTPSNVVSTPAANQEVLTALERLEINGGGDFPEAVKTALHTLLQEAGKDG